MNKGTWYALSAYLLWGIFPVYWKLLQHVPAPELLGHRIVWSFISLAFALGLWRGWDRIRKALRTPKTLVWYVASAALIGVNWLTYIWAVNAGFIVETSLGYFINPLLSVAMGVVFFRERLRRGQWIAIALAAAGVLYLTFVHGSLPWIALTLAVTFSCYGLVKKIAPLGSFDGLTLETGILFLPALAWLLFSETTGNGAFIHAGMLTTILLVGAGPVTSIPLLLFTLAAQRIPLSVVGILQYVAPTLQFLLGVLVYHEPFSATRLVGFGIVWVALIVYPVEGILVYRRRTIKITRAH
jgi:chloramphenicol-sensitive protein RarD